MASCMADDNDDGSGWGSLPPIFIPLAKWNARMCSSTHAGIHQQSSDFCTFYRHHIQPNLNWKLKNRKKTTTTTKKLVIGWCHRPSALECIFPSVDDVMHILTFALHHLLIRKKSENSHFPIKCLSVKGIKLEDTFRRNSKLPIAHSCLFIMNIVYLLCTPDKC